MSDPNLISDELYFFRMFANNVSGNKSEGLAFNSKEAAWQEASNSAGEIIRDLGSNMDPGLDWRMDVTDSRGALIYRLSFKTEEF